MKLDLAELEKALGTDRMELWAKLDRQLPRFRKILLGKLANQELALIPRTLAHFQPEPESMYISAQANLRKLTGHARDPRGFIDATRQAEGGGDHAATSAARKARPKKFARP